MSLNQASLVIPAHMLPGGVAPIASEFGFEQVDKRRLENGESVVLTQYTFHSPLGTVDKTLLDKTFDKATEHFIWHLAKGTPYQINKSFSDGTQSSKSYVYRNNRLTTQTSPLAELLANSQ